MRITVEVCPTSNLQTIPELAGDIRNHPVKRMIERGMAVAIATDNTLVSHTDLNRELALVGDVCALDLAGFKRLVLAGFKGAFYPGRYMEKRMFVRRAAERFERLVARFKRETANNGDGGKTCVF
jgi:adenosine deaminase